MDNPRDDIDTGASLGLEELTREECLALLAVNSVGRIAVIGRDDMPFVVPVNYQLTGETVVFRTDHGTKLDALRRRPVAFQIDEVDPLQRTGWSVLLQGVAHEVSPHEVGDAVVEPWLRQKHHWIQLVPRFISGRRIRLPDVFYEPGGYL
jgi:nitroimidazol reductase NimA-like FMN-containing flavoprotein (pyridoxamine 5'-phosphate oxidase superfamily)